MASSLGLMAGRGNPAGFGVSVVFQEKAAILVWRQRPGLVQDPSAFAELRAAVSTCAASPEWHRVIFIWIQGPTAGSSSVVEADAAGGFSKAATAAESLSPFRNLVGELLSLSQVVVGVAMGAVTSEGASLLAACDMVVAERTATITVSHSAVAAVAPVFQNLMEGADFKAPMSSKIVSVDAALKAGLISVIADSPVHLDSITSELMNMLKNSSPERLGMVKSWMRSAEGPDSERARGGSANRGSSMYKHVVSQPALPRGLPLTRIASEVPESIGSPYAVPGPVPLRPSPTSAPMKVHFSPFLEESHIYDQVDGMDSPTRRQVLQLSQLLGGDKLSFGLGSPWSSNASTATSMADSLSDMDSSPGSSLELGSFAPRKSVVMPPPGLAAPPGLETMAAPVLSAPRPKTEIKSSWPPSAPAAGADGSVTSLMIRNIPCRVSRQQLIDTINGMGFSGTFDFLYVPTGGRPTPSGSCPNRGYGFINFFDGSDASRFTAVFNGYRFDGTLSTKACEVEPAQLQGLANNIRGVGGRSAAKRRARGRLDAAAVPTVTAES